LNWSVTGEDLDQNFLPLVGMESSNRSKFDLLSTHDLWQEFRGPVAESSYLCNPGTRIAIPADATIIMEEPFVAYYHPTAKGNVGYLRIPDYYPQKAGTEEFEYALRFAQYEYAVETLEKNTVGLIIDQDHNCGGSISYLHQIASLFMREPFETQRFRLLANKEMLLDYGNEADMASPYTMEYRYGMDILNVIKKAWDAGDRMTELTPIWGPPTTLPNPIHYTKPIVMLMDEMSGSGGDAFPAMLGGLGRATLLGTRTMGAGGNVVEAGPLNYSRIGMRITKSLFYRPDGIPVENNGAVPHIPYTITREDFVGEYKNYQAFYLNKLLDKVNSR